MNKTITINPDLFRFTNNRTMRKRKTNSDAPEIKVRAPPKDNSKTVSKHHVLRFIRDQQEKGCINVEYVATEDQLADIFTKPLPGPRFNMLREKIGIKTTEI